LLELRSKVGTRGQVVIPGPIREMFDIQAGENVFFRVSNGEVILRREDGRITLDNMLSRVDKKKPEPKKMDWDAEHYSQFGE